MTILREAVKSSNVASMGYDAASRLMDVEFHPGKDKAPRVYRYDDVPEEEYSAVRQAESVGKALRERIIGKFRATRIA